MTASFVSPSPQKSRSRPVRGGFTVGIVALGIGCRLKVRGESLRCLVSEQEHLGSRWIEVKRSSDSVDVQDIRVSGRIGSLLWKKIKGKFCLPQHSQGSCLVQAVPAVRHRLDRPHISAFWNRHARSIFQVPFKGLVVAFIQQFAPAVIDLDVEV